MALAAHAFAVAPAGAQGMVGGVDLTVGYDPIAVHRTVTERVETDAPDGAHVIVYAITAHTLTETIVLAETHLPTYPGIRRSDRRDAIRAFGEELLRSLQGTYDPSFFQASLISDFFELAAQFFAEHEVRPRERRMLIISDGLQVDGDRNWESQAIDFTGLQVPRIGGMLSFYGVTSENNRGEKWREVRTAWHEILAPSEITIQSYSSALP